MRQYFLRPFLRVVAPLLACVACGSNDGGADAIAPSEGAAYTVPSPDCQKADRILSKVLTAIEQCTRQQNAVGGCDQVVLKSKNTDGIQFRRTTVAELQKKYNGSDPLSVHLYLVHDPWVFAAPNMYMTFSTTGQDAELFNTEGARVDAGYMSGRYIHGPSDCHSPGAVHEVPINNGGDPFDP